MADPLFYEFIGVPSAEAERSRAIISSPAAATNHQGYYDSFLSRRRGRTEPNFARRAYNMKDWQRSQAQADYETEAQTALKSLTTLDPGDPTVQQKQEQLLFNSRYGQTLVRDPRVVSALKNTISQTAALQKQFESDPDSRMDYIMGRQKGLDHQTAFAQAISGTENRKNRLWFAEKGGNLEDFDRFSPDGRFDRAAAQQYLNTVPSRKDANKPWQERLSFKEGEAIREMARGARELTDFEEEYATLRKDNPKLTRDEYVKQFKNAPSFEAYRQKRLGDAGDQVMRDYGLSREEAAAVLGIEAAAPTAAAAPQADAWSDRTTSGPLALPTTSQASGPSNPAAWADRTTSGGTAPIPGLPAQAATAAAPTAAPAPVSQADLKRIDEVAPAAPAPPQTFETLSQQIVQRAADQRKAREDEYLSRQKIEEDQSRGWEQAKQQILQNVTAEDLSMDASAFTADSTREPYAILSRMGRRPSDEAFKTPDGKAVTWGQALEALILDPRWKQAASGGTVTAPSRKSLSHLWEDVKGAVTGK